MIFKSKAKMISLFFAILCCFFCFSSCEKKVNISFVDSNESATSASGKESQKKTDKEVQLTRDEVFEKVKPSIVKVWVYDYDRETVISQGSGFFIDSEGGFITNAHVIKGAYYIKIQTSSEKIYDVDAVLKYNDSSSDYAICRAKGIKSSVPVKFTDSASSGDIVYALGFPKDALSISTTSGKITSTNAVLGEKQYYINTAKIDHGSSGGALIDHKGRVLGITTGSSSDGEYVALKYQNFRADLEAELGSGKEPIKCFHAVKKYEFNPSTISDYFEIYVDVISYTDSSINYEVGARLKEEYQDAKLVLDTVSISAITVEMVTKYDYYDFSNRESPKKLEEDSKILHLHFSTLEEMKNGIALSVNSASEGFNPNSCYEMQMTYEADFWSVQSGTLTIYD